MSRMATLEGCSRDAYAYVTRNAPWWPPADHALADDHVAYIAGMAVGYVEAMLWSSTDPATEEPLDTVAAIVDDVELEACAALCATIYVHHAADLRGFRPWSDDAAQAGHDLALTRNGHGAGFWDRNAHGTPGWHAGNRLTAAAQELGECYPYLWVREDGRLTVVELAATRYLPTEAERANLRAGWPDVTARGGAS